MKNTYLQIECTSTLNESVFNNMQSYKEHYRLLHSQLMSIVDFRKITQDLSWLTYTIKSEGSLS